MYLCLDCERLFEEPSENYSEGLEHFGTPCYRTWSGCPNCSGAYVETYECGRCGEYITREYIEVAGNEKICENCYDLKNIADSNY